jgi:hypothetical protein
MQTMGADVIDQSRVQEDCGGPGGGRRAVWQREDTDKIRLTAEAKGALGYHRWSARLVSFRMTVAGTSGPLARSGFHRVSGKPR